MLVKANEVLLDKIDDLKRSCEYNGKYVQRLVNGRGVEDLYFGEDGELKTYCTRGDTHQTVLLDENGMFDLGVYIISYDDVTEQLFGG